MSEKELTFEEFCDRLIAEGANIHEDGHVYRADGRRLSRQCRNGYFLLRKQYGHHTYHFMEHRVVWYMVNGSIDNDLEINHKDFDRTNNRIENLELTTHSENMQYTIKAGRSNPQRGTDSPKSIYTEKDVQLMRYLVKNGYSRKQVAALFGTKYPNVIGRIVNGTRYGNVPDAADITAVYPLLVEKTCRSDLPWEEQVNNAILGMVGEVGELIDMYKKHLYQGHELDLNHFYEEVGDVLYYLVWLLNLFDLDLSEVLYENIVKLEARYPNGFEVERSVNRSNENF